LVGIPEGDSHLEDLGLGGRMILKRILRRESARMWSGLIWLRIGTRGRIISTWQRTFGFLNMREFLE
jgi:hypothetical protein